MLSSIFGSVESQAKFQRTTKPDEYVRPPASKKRKSAEDEMDEALTQEELKRLKPRKERKPKKEIPDIEEATKEEDDNKTDNKTDDDGNNTNNKEKDSRTVFVGNVSITTTLKQLSSYMKGYGEIESIRMRSVPTEGVKGK